MPPKPFFTFGSGTPAKRHHNEIDDADTSLPRTRDGSEDEERKQAENNAMQQ